MGSTDLIGSTTSLYKRNIVIDKKDKSMKASTAKILLLAALLLGLTDIAAASTGGDTQDVTIAFDEISVLAASGDPGTLTITAPAVAGDLPDDVMDANTTMAWTCNVAAVTTRTITGSIDGLFSGINLSATVAAPGSAGGTSAGQVLFAAAATAYDFVTLIGNTNISDQTITFRAHVTAMVAPYTDTTQTVTWTLTEDG
jgi:hypothetical protein